MSETSRVRRGMPRLLSRALFVLGGAVAGTAAAWLISSASASADTLPVPAPVLPSAAAAGPVAPQAGAIVPAVTGSLAATANLGSAVPAAAPSTVSSAVPSAVPSVLPEALPRTLPGTWPTALSTSDVRSTSGLSLVTERLRDAVTEFDALGGNPLAGQFRTPAPSRAGAPVPAPAVIGAPRGVAGAPVGQTAGAAGTWFVPAAHRTGSASVPASVRHSGHDLPGLPGGQQYNTGLVPAGAGTAGSGGCAGPGGSALGAQFVQPGLPGQLSSVAGNQGNPFASVTPGKQPGVTPD